MGIPPSYPLQREYRFPGRLLFVHIGMYAGLERERSLLVPDQLAYKRLANENPAQYRRKYVLTYPVWLPMRTMHQLASHASTVTAVPTR